MKRKRREKTYIFAKSFGILKRYGEYRRGKRRMEEEICIFFAKKIKLKFLRLWEGRREEKEEKRWEDEERKKEQESRRREEKEERRRMFESILRRKTFQKWHKLWKGRTIMKKYLELWRGEEEQRGVEMCSKRREENMRKEVTIKRRIFEAWKDVIEDNELWKEQKLANRLAENHWRTFLKVKVFCKLKMERNRKTALLRFFPLLKVIEC